MPFVKIPPGIKIDYQIKGNPAGDSLILLHGWGGNKLDMDILIDKLSPAIREKYAILTITHRGHGDSDKPEGESESEILALYTMDQLAEDLKAVIDALNLDTPLILGGHSMGGMITFTFALKYPDLVKKIIPMSTTAGYDDPDHMRVIVDQYKNGTLPLDREGRRALIFGTAYSSKYIRQNKALIEEHLDFNLKTPDFVLKACLENFSLNYFVKDKLGEIKVPTLVLHGKWDGMQPYQNAVEIEEKMPNAKAVIIPKGPHMIIEETPEPTAQAIEEFLIV